MSISSHMGVLAPVFAVVFPFNHKKHPLKEDTPIWTKIESTNTSPTGQTKITSFGAPAACGILGPHVLPKQAADYK